MVSIPSRTPTGLGGQAIARIVGFTCLFGFLADMLALALPIGAGAAWRASLLQQMGNGCTAAHPIQAGQQCSQRLGLGRS